MTFAVALVALLVGHQLGDHVFQTDSQANEKASAGRAGAVALARHLFGYHLTATVVLVGTAAVLGLPLSVAGVAAEWRSPPRRTASSTGAGRCALLRATGSAGFAELTTPVCGMYAADQALHQGALLVSALLVAGLA
ncbi:DUF3307 domain-containing protein [Luedemannella flava]